MENPGNPRSILRDQKCASSPETKFATHTHRGTKLRDFLKSDKPVNSNLSYADFHYEITKNLDATLPRYVDSQQSQVTDRKDSKEDELVKYMSNVPSYLEKGKNQDIAFNVGVLDWRRLEKWRCSQKQMPGQLMVCSSSSSTSSLFSIDGSSAHSSRGLSRSPAHQRVNLLPLQSTLEESSKEALVRDAKPSSGRGNSCPPTRQKLLPPVPQYHSQKVRPGGRTYPDIEVCGEVSQKFQDSPVSSGNNVSGQQMVSGAMQCQRRESDLKSVSGTGKHQHIRNYEVEAPWKGKSKAQVMESAKETIRSQESKLIAPNKGCLLRDKSGDVFMPRDLSKHNCSSLTAISSITMDGRLSVDQCQRNNLETHLPPENDHHKKKLEPSDSSLQHANGVKTSYKHSKIPLQPTIIVRSPCKNNAQGIRGPAQTSHVLSFPARKFTSPSKSRNGDKKKPYGGPMSDLAVQATEDVAVRRISASVPKARNPSPIRRLGSAMGKLIKNAGSRDNSPICRSGPKDSVIAKSRSGVVSSVFTDNPYCDKLSTNNNNRGRSSPLRRFLDPLLKPRASNCYEPSKKPSSTMVGTINSSDEPLDLSQHSVKVKLRPASSTTLVQSQALLQVSFKNGFPLYTFAIDNESKILAATVKKSSVLGKGHHSWTYTFFSIHEFRRTGSWLSQRGESDGPCYLPNALAQMKVSDSLRSLTKSDKTDHYITREFDLFAVDGDQFANDFHPTFELAAIVVELSRSAAENDKKDEVSNYNWLETPQDSCEEQQMRPANSSYNSLKSQNFSSTVILPGGVHTVPSKGELSTLAERWRSGGSCDCGGWDLGCQLRVYTNKNEHETRSGSSGTLQNEKFQLFSQENQDGKPILSLAPFRERIYAMEYSSSLSHLQAFAICMSFIDCRRPPELPETSVPIEKMAEACVFEIVSRTKTSNQSEAPAKYFSNPPHSPVDRV